MATRKALPVLTKLSFRIAQFEIFTLPPLNDFKQMVEGQLSLKAHYSFNPILVELLLYSHSAILFDCVCVLPIFPFAAVLFNYMFCFARISHSPCVTM